MITMSLPVNFNSIARMLKRKRPVKFKSPGILLANEFIEEQYQRTLRGNLRNNCLDAHIVYVFSDGGGMMIVIDFGAQPAKG